MRGRIWWYTQDRTGEGGREFVSMLCVCAGSGRGEEGEGEGEGCRNRGAQPTYTDHTGITDIYGPVPTPTTEGFTYIQIYKTWHSPRTYSDTSTLVGAASTTTTSPSPRPSSVCALSAPPMSAYSPLNDDITSSLTKSPVISSLDLLSCQIYLPTFSQRRLPPSASDAILHRRL